MVGQQFSPLRERMESNPDTKRACMTVCQQCRENEPEQGSEYCTVCLVMFAMLKTRAWCDPF
jgi:hypothetical protein